MTTLLFTFTIFVSSALLFFVQPLVARAVLPALGGTPAVWNTCAVFFQAMLLIGYGYAYVVSRRASSRLQGVLHLVLIITTISFLPDSLTPRTLDPITPIESLLQWLAATVGLPFVLLSMSAPLLQSWFHRLRPGKDPYVLYAASNVGSLTGLLLYPLLVEPRLGLTEQSIGLLVSYFLFALMMISTATTTLLAKRAPIATDSSPRPNQIGILTWISLSFLPSALFLAVTTHLTTNISPMPLLWVMPLAIYLVAFIIGFSGTMTRLIAINRRALPFALLLLTPFLYFELGGTAIWMFVIHLLALGIISLAAVGELHARRPPPDRLAEFYLWVAFGGVLGGVFITFVAPALFSTLVEYPLLVIGAALLLTRPVSRSGLHEAIDDLCSRRTLAAVAAFVVASALPFMLELSRPVQFLFLFGLPALLTFSLKARPAVFCTLFVLMNLGISAFEHFSRSSDRLVQRNFYGVKRIVETSTSRQLVHGGTIHGIQNLSAEERFIPAGYYARSGPLGEIFAAARADSPAFRAALIGLGIGTIAAYAGDGDHFEFFELDPQVKELAQNTDLFTFLSNCGARCTTEVGDGRLLLAKGVPGYKLIISDAFSSDAIPIHLLSKEAIQLYRSKLSRDGIIAFHISNRYLALQRAIAAAARDLKLNAFWKIDPMSVPESGKVEPGKIESTYAVLTLNDKAGDALIAAGWSRLQAEPAFRAWTDDYSSVWTVFKK